MTPTSAHKQGARYRYYVSAPLMQGRREEAGSVPRVPAPDIEQLVFERLRSEVASSGCEGHAEVDRHSVLQHVRRVEVRSGSVLIELVLPSKEQTNGVDAARSVRLIPVPWSPPPGRVRRIVVAPASDTAAHFISMRADTRATLLVAIAKARRWLGELSSHQVASFGAISAREGCTERYVRSILPLAFLAPEVVKPPSTDACPILTAPRGWPRILRRAGTSRSACSVSTVGNDLIIMVAHAVLGELRSGYWCVR